MTGWWIATGCLMLAVLALTPTYRRRRHRRRRLDKIRAQVEASLSEFLKQPDGASVTPTGGTVRRRHTVVSGDLASDTTVGPRWRML